MKVSIEIVDGKVSIQVDDDKPITVTTGKKIEMPNSTVLVKPETERGGGEPPKKSPEPAEDTRKCEICGNSLAGLDPRAKVCSKECLKAKQRQYAKAHYEKKHGATRKERDVGEAHWCKHCNAYTTHDTAHHVTEIQTEPDLRSKCCDAKVKDHERASGVSVHTCLGCARQCDVYDLNKAGPPKKRLAAQKRCGWCGAPTGPGRKYCNREHRLEAYKVKYRQRYLASHPTANRGLDPKFFNEEEYRPPPPKWTEETYLERARKSNEALARRAEPPGARPPIGGGGASIKRVKRVYR